MELNAHSTWGSALEQSLIWGYKVTPGCWGLGDRAKGLGRQGPCSGLGEGDGGGGVQHGVGVGEADAVPCLR